MRNAAPRARKASRLAVWAVSVLFFSTVLHGAHAQEARRPADNDAAPRAAPDVRLTYGDHHNQFVDLRLPASDRFGPGPYPTILVLHGGCWVRPYASARNIGALADALRNEGYATLNVEYRTVDEAGGGWPGTFHDVAGAADRVRVWAKTYALDPDRLATVGHSAGGHLAVWLAARTNISPTSPLYRKNAQSVRGAVVLGGPGDILNARASWTKGCGVDSVTPLLGGEALRTFNASAGNPSALLPFPAKQILITGSNDRIVPAFLGTAYTEQVREAGAMAVHRILEGVSHHDYLNTDDPRTWPEILNAFEEIFSTP